jgi:hypothetical protein
MPIILLYNPTIAASLFVNRKSKKSKQNKAQNHFKRAVYD